MCAFIASNTQDDPERSQYIIGFPKGLNTIQDRSLVNDKNLIEATNVMLVVDGLTRRYGSDRVFNAGGTKVLGAAPFYIKTTNVRYQVRAVKTGANAAKLQYRQDAATTWTDVSGGTLTSANPVNFCQARNRLYIFNGVDTFRYLDTTLTLTSFSAINNPTAPTITPQGSAGTTAYSYKIQAFNTTGVSAVSSAGTTATGNATLTTTNFNRVTWSTVTGATGYNIYGRKSTGYKEVYLATVYGETTTTYDDTGADTHVTAKLPETENTTAGVIAKKGIYTLGRLFLIGVMEGSTYNPTRLYYSGTLDQINAFTDSYGGGWVDIFSNDGGELVEEFPFQNGILVGKTNGVHKFYFTSSGLPALSEITREHGMVSSRCSWNVNNDIMYVGQRENKIGVYTAGQQANYTGDQVRTNLVTQFIDNSLTDVNRTYLSNICTFYYDDKFGFSYTKAGLTENSEGYIIDTRFGGWVKWDNLPMEVTQYTVYDDGFNSKLYGCSNADGYMIEMFLNERNDDGEAFRTVVGTKFFNGNMFDVEKIFRNPVLWFKYIQGGTFNAEVWTDGTKLTGTAPLASTQGGAGSGADLSGGFLPGHMASSVTAFIVNADTPKELSFLRIARSLGIYLIDENINSNWLFMGLHILYTPLEGKPLPSSSRVTVK